MFVKLFIFVHLATFCFFIKACFDIATYDTKACNEHRVTIRVLKSTLIHLPYKMVVNCNTVLFEFGGCEREF